MERTNRKTLLAGLIFDNMKTLSGGKLSIDMHGLLSAMRRFSKCNIKKTHDRNSATSVSVEFTQFLTRCDCCNEKIHHGNMAVFFDGTFELFCDYCL